MNAHSPKQHDHNLDTNTRLALLEAEALTAKHDRQKFWEELGKIYNVLNDIKNTLAFARGGLVMLLKVGTFMGIIAGLTVATIKYVKGGS